MKKSIVLIALILIAVTGIFASAYETLPEDKTTDVTLTLSQEPSYVMAITKKANKATEDSTALTKEDSIALDYAKDETLKISYTTADTYFVSYRFFESEKVALKMALSGDMTLGGKATTDSSEKIPYQVTISKNGDVTPDTTSIKSDDTAAHTIETVDAADVKGKVDWNNFEFNIVAFDENSDTVKDKKIGSYKATITLSVVANS